MKHDLLFILLLLFFLGCDSSVNSNDNTTSTDTQLNDIDTSTLSDDISRCCQDNTDCPLPLECVDDLNGSNVCKETINMSKNKCWSDEHCQEGQICSEAQICPCHLSLENCDTEDKPGECMNITAGCCDTHTNIYGEVDTDTKRDSCPENYFCLDIEDKHPTCHLLPKFLPEADCWIVDNCEETASYPSNYCTTTLCDCNETCFSALGSCVWIE